MDPDDQHKMRWTDLSTGQQAALIGVAAVEIGLLVAALVDLKRRPADQVRGPKGAWVAASFVNFVGPISYFAFGRKR
ncbi:PLD nuclease N-terminal domain-containing protein [Occultella kanbiaonis]|uniref:PLD nuclease N-terminal domain-containing protein n=1 Tax=Occultella kanbiaonis TaxID=2675754 RepID=UPI0012B6FDCD|nr:PLD nuclease N-terminal domain-containing protein [Occultella kanbiaonis]